MVKPKFLADANEDTIELEAYGATNQNLCRVSEAGRTISNEESGGADDWGTRH
jgi:hypothetical protein